nr:unnamed protein product [Callosobruchus chinensis]
MLCIFITITHHIIWERKGFPNVKQVMLFIFFRNLKAYSGPNQKPLQWQFSEEVGSSRRDWRRVLELLISNQGLHRAIGQYTEQFKLLYNLKVTTNPNLARVDSSSPLCWSQAQEKREGWKPHFCKTTHTQNPQRNTTHRHQPRNSDLFKFFRGRTPGLTAWAVAMNKPVPKPSVPSRRPFYTSFRLTS